MLPEISSALRAALPNADIQLLDAVPTPSSRNLHAAPPQILVTARWLISTNGSETEYEAALGQLLRNPVLTLEGQTVALTVVAAQLDEKARLWLALGLPFRPCILVEAGPLAC